MKASAGKATHKTADRAARGSSAGENAVALAPPAYGVDFVDNRTGMPDRLKAGIEALCGLSLDEVKVHYGSSRPAQLSALAYAQGTDIHLAPGQERHLPHEAWHVVQQAQGRVKPTLQMKKGIALNDNEALEREAEAMGAKALQVPAGGAAAAPRSGAPPRALRPIRACAGAAPVQRRVGFEFEIGDIATQHRGFFGGWHNHAKGDVLSRLPGYKLTADIDQGQSQLEVIIDLIDETDPAAVANLVAVTGPAVVNTIDTIAQTAFNNWTQANQIPGVNGNNRDRYRSGANGAAGIMGQLQMTGGIAMNKLHDHLTGAQGTNYVATLNPANQDDAVAVNTLNVYTLGPVAVAATGIVNAVGALAGLTAAQRNQIAAIAALMANVPINMRRPNPVPYPKGAAGALLARTDFSRIMMALPGAVKDVLTRAIMRAIVVDTVNAMLPALPVPVVGADPVIPIGAPLPPAVPALNQLSIDSWVGSAVPREGLLWGHRQGRDRLTRRNFPASKRRRAWLESMGSYGDRMDPGNKPILEFRSLAGVFVTDLPGQLQRLADFLNHP